MLPCSVFLLVLASPAGADPVPKEPSTSPYAVDWLSDGALLLALSAVTQLSSAAVLTSLEPATKCPKKAGAHHCDRDSVNRLDRSVIGNRSRAWARVSNYGRYGSYLAAIAATGGMAVASGGEESWLDWAEDGLVIAISVNTAILTTHILKYVMARPRPLQYEADTYRATVARERSFPSGHATGTAAIGAAVASTFAYRFPTSPWRYAVAGAGILLTGLTAYGRVGSGQHFYSDIVAGAAIGGSVGLLIPRAYRQNAPVAIASLNAPGFRGLSLVFTL